MIYKSSVHAFTLLWNSSNRVIPTMLATKDPIIFELDSSLSVEEKIERIVQDKDRRDAEAWTMMPQLFDKWGKL